MDTQTQQCRHLLASVVHLAVSDACLPPNKEGPARDASTAIAFLFDQNYSGLNEYAEFLDFDPGQFRTRLLKIMRTHSVGEIGGYSESQRINFMNNYKFWQFNPQVWKEMKDVDD